jgi:hypothetical protein
MSYEGGVVLGRCRLQVEAGSDGIELELVRVDFPHAVSRCTTPSRSILFTVASRPTITLGLVLIKRYTAKFGCAQVLILIQTSWHT